MSVRALVASLLLSVANQAHATEVVWLGNAPEDQRARVAELDGYTGPLDALDFRSAGTRSSGLDDRAYAKLESALQEVRPYELKLDGELVIMADLQAPMDAITVIRGPEDRATLFRALAYQGFAVSRYFDTALGTDPEAEPWRVELDASYVERPWRDAAALDPSREVTPYEIAETPQRLAYSSVQDKVTGALPGGFRVEGLPAGALIRVDGRPADDTASTIRVPAGKHWIHVEQEGRVLQRWTVDLTPGGTEVLTLPLTEAVWQGFVRGLSPQSPVPDALLPHLEALGGEVWFARAGSKQPTVLRVTAQEVTEIELPKIRGSSGSAAADGLSVAGFIGTGWISSGDFYLGNLPDAPQTRATVNSLSVVPAVGLSYDRGLLRAGAGVDMAVTPGAFHYARYGESTTRLRPTPHLEVGTRYATVIAGWTFPHHPVTGLRAQLPLPKNLELRADGRIGFGGDRQRVDGSTYRIQPLYTAFLSIGYRWSPQ